jgi:hypothetical protein
MGRQFIITENDKQRILSLYGLITEETTTSIVGKVVSEYIMSADILNYSESKIPLEDVEVILSTIENGYLVKKQQTTKTDSDGGFKFTNLNITSNILITIPEFGLFKKTEKKILSIKSNVENKLGDFVLTPKEEVINKQTSSEANPCGDFKSTEDEYYGYGQGPMDVSSWDPNNLTLSKPIIMALQSAVLEYFKTNEDINANIEEITDAVTNIKNKLDYEIVCNKNIMNNNYVVVKITKEGFENFILDLMMSNNKITPEDESKIEFEDIPFKVALQRSWDFDRNIFLLVGLNSDDNTKETLNKLNSSKNNVEILNSSKYLPLYYQVDSSNEDHYMAASEPLNINTYPTVVVLKASKDPKTNYIKDSIETLSKIDGVSNDLTSLDDLKL